MYLLVGLGNPGSEYENNRHNIGFMALDEIVRRHSFGGWRRRFHGSVSEGQIGGRRAIALKPDTFMNRSGQAVAAATRYYRLEVEDIIVLHDDLDLEPGKIRVKQGGGSAGHNGLRSIDTHVGKNYRRVRFGIGHPGERDQVENYVLKDVPKAESEMLENNIMAIADHIAALALGDVASFTNDVALQTGSNK
jgi:PTH1 family peptidyl-tRNA hydrolase